MESAKHTMNETKSLLQLCGIVSNTKNNLFTIVKLI